MEASWADAHVSQSDTVPPVRGASDAAIVALRSALQARLRGWLEDGELRRAIRLLCDEAHRRGMGAEQLLVMLKQAWASVAGTSNFPLGPERDELSKRVITMCIEEFYAEQTGCW